MHMNVCRKGFLIICLLILAMPICFAGDNVSDINQDMIYEDSGTNMISTINTDDSVLSEDDDYNHLYFNASVSTNGNGSKEKPYKTLPYLNLNNKTVLHFADGTYSRSSNFDFTVDVKIIGQSRENTIVNLNNRAFMTSNEESTLTIQNITLLKTPVISYYGGVIECDGVIFKNTSNTQIGTSEGSYGGAIFTLNNLNLNNCVFENVNATRGGAIYSDGNTVINNTIFRNTSAGRGGVIYSEGDVEIYNSKIINSTGSNDGGGVYNNGNLKVENCSFHNNSGRGGGAINTGGGDVIIIKSNFTLNHAISYGGAISCSPNSVITIAECNFENNTAEMSAGAFYFINSICDIYDSNFTCNSATFGGAICDLNTTTTYNKVKFKYNRGFDGGAVYKMYASAVISETEFFSNEARNGGGFYVDYADSVVLTDSRFEDNVADYGGAVYSSATGSNLSLNNVEFVNNNANVSCEVYEVTQVGLIRSWDNFTVFNMTENFTTIPGKYDMRDYDLLTPVKNQEDEGNCWAFAAIATLESCILKATGEHYDFSEENMKNIASKFSKYGEIDNDANGGGNSYMSIGYLVSWLGPVMDTEDTYSANTLSPVLDAVTHIQNVLWIKRTSYTDNDGIKEAILKYGAVATSINYNSNYMKDSTYSYYYYSSTSTNHAVTIVGWDDDYSKSNFKTAPEGDGAFIVRNSWGSSWGENGYFYVSYYDTSFASLNNPYAIYTFILNDTHRYEKIYQYETIIAMAQYSRNMTVKNVFTAESDELICAVSNYFYNNETHWEISINVNGELKHSQTGTSTFGYYTTPLTEYVPVKQGDLFEVIYRIYSFNTETKIIVSRQDNRRLKMENVSYLLSNNGKTWQLVSPNYVFPIKAFTVNGKLNTTLSVNSIDNWDFGKEYTLQATVKDQYGSLINTGSIIFSIDGQNYTVDVVDGNANKTIIFNHTGNHNITVLFNETDYYYSSNITQTVTINPHTTQLSLYLNSTELYAGDSLKITANVNATQGKVDFYIDNVLRGSVNVDSDGNAVLIVNNITYGIHNITAKYTDSNNDYVNSSDNSSFNVRKKEITVNANNLIISYHDNEILNILIKNGDEVLGNLNVNLTVNNITTVKKTNSEGLITIDLSEYECGVHNITVSVNDTHYIGEKNIQITVNRINPNITVKTSNITVGEDVVLNISLNNDATGNITVKINNKTYNKNLSNGNAILKISNLTSGIHNISITYNGDNNYKTSNISTAVTVNKKTSLITVTANNITYGDDLIVNISVGGEAGGNITCMINNHTYSLKLTDGLSLLNISNLSAGPYDISITYNGDENYNTNSTQVNVNVVQAGTVINANASNITYNNKVNVKGNITSTANTVKTDKINVSVYDDNDQIVFSADKTIQELINGFDLNELGAGNYTLNITYKGNDNFTGNSTSVKFTVNKANTNITASINNSTLKVIGNINNMNTNVNVPTQSTVNVIIHDENNNIAYNEIKTLAELKNGFNINELYSGNFTMNIIYEGNENFTGNKTTVNFIISKIQTKITANATNTTYSNPTTIEYKIDSKNNMSIPLTENITYRIYKNDSTPVTNEMKIQISQTTIHIGNLTAGNYYIVLKYDGNANFTGNETLVEFRVNKANTNTHINASSVTYTNKSHIIGTVINLNTTASIPDTNMVNITVYDKNNKIVYSANKMIRDLNSGFDLGVLGAGNYTVNGTYSGNENFTGSSGTGKFTVNKANTTLSVNASSVIYNNSLILNVEVTSVTNVPDNGIISINIYDKNNNLVYTYNNTINAFNTGFELCVLDAGDYTVKAAYLDSENFTQSNTTVKFTVNKANTRINANATNITYNNKVTVKYAVNNLNTTAPVPDDEIMSYAIFSGKTMVRSGNITVGDGVFDVSNLSAGEYCLNLYYYGDGNFIESNTTVNFTVEKAKTNIIVNARNTIYNNPVKINGSLTSDIVMNNKILTIFIYDQDNKLIYVDNKTMEEFNNGFDVDGLAAGNYTVEAVYYDDENFTGSYSACNLTVNKAGTNITASIDNSTLKVTGRVDNLDTTAEVPVQDNVIITVYDNAGIVYNETRSIGELNSSFNLNSLNAGNYTLNIQYNGNENYTESNINVKFVIRKITTRIIANVTNATYNNNVNVKFGVVSNSNNSIPSYESVTYTVYNSRNEVIMRYNNITVNINGSEFDLVNLSAGSYYIVIEYAGDVNHTGSDFISNFTVLKAKTNITVNASDITFNNKTHVTGSVFNTDSIAGVPDTGIVRVIVYDKNNNKVYTVNKTILELMNGFDLSVLGAGNYTVNVTYPGHENFTDCSTIAKFTVNKASTTLSMNASSVTYNNTSHINAAVTSVINVPDNDIISINIHDKNNNLVYTYNNTINAFNTGFELCVLDAGDYTVKAAYLDSENFTQSNTTVKFTVNKANTRINANATNITYNNKVTVKYAVNNLNTTAPVPDDEIMSYAIFSGKTMVRSGNITVGDGVFDVSNLSAGEYCLNLYYYGDGNFIESNTTVNFTVEKAKTNIIVNARNTIYNNPVKINGSLTSDIVMNNKILTILIYDQENKLIYVENKTMEEFNNGFEVDGLAAGNYTVEAVYYGDENFTGSYSACNLTVNKAETNITASIDNSTLKVTGRVDNLDTTADVPVQDNVIITVYDNDGIVYNETRSIGELNSSFNLNSLNAGNYTLNILYNGNENYTESYISVKFVISKIATRIMANVMNVTYDNEVIVKFEVTSNSNRSIPSDETVTYTVYNSRNEVITRYNNITLNINESEFDLVNLSAGSYCIVIEYAGDVNYTDCIAGVNFTVLKAKTNITVSTSNITFNNKTRVTGSVFNIDSIAGVPDNGIVRVIVYDKNNNKVYTVDKTILELMNGFDLSVLGAGNYTVNVTYHGNENFTDCSSIGKFTVNKASTTLSMNASSVIYNNTSHINAAVTSVTNVPDNGIISINVYDENNNLVYTYNSTIKLFNTGFYLDVLDAGDYTVKATYIGSENFTQSSTTVKFTVSKVNTRINANATNSTYNNGVTVNYTVNNLNTTVPVPDNEIISYDIFSGKTMVRSGNVTVGDGGFDVNNLSAGEYCLNLYYYGDGDFIGSNTTVNFTIKKAETRIIVNATNTTYNNPVVVKGSVTSIVNVSGDGIISIMLFDGQNRMIYTGNKTFDELKSGFTMTDLIAGDYTLNASYAGDENFTESVTAVKFTVKKAITNINVTAGNATYNDHVNVKGHLTPDVGDNEIVTVYVYDDEYRFVYSVNKTVMELEAGFDLSVLGAGTYIADVIYPGSENFTGSNATVKFTVNKAKTNITASVDNSTLKVTGRVNNADTQASVPVQDNVIIIVYDKDGIVYNETRSIFELNNAFNLNNLNAGNYSLSILYNGNENYTESRVSFEFVINKITSKIIANASNVTYDGEVHVKYGIIVNSNKTIPSDENVTYTVYNNQNEVMGNYNNISININESGFDLVNLSAGDYFIIIKYAGDVNYTGSDVRVNFKVTKAKTDITANVTGTIFNNRANVKGSVINTDSAVAVPDNGVVSIGVYDEKGDEIYTVNKSIRELNEGFDLNVLGAGDYMVNATYLGSENFTKSNTTIPFTIRRAGTVIIADADNVTFNSAVIIRFNVNNSESDGEVSSVKNITYHVYDYENNIIGSYNALISNGQISISNLGAGRYYVNVTYNGDGDFKGSSTVTAFEIKKASTEINVSAGNVTYKNPVSVRGSIVSEVNVSGSAAVNIVIYDMNNKSVYASNKTLLEFNNAFNVNDLGAGSYTIHVTYDGDDNFTGSAAVCRFSVAKSNVTVVVNTTNTVYNNPVYVIGDAGLSGEESVNITVYSAQGNVVYLSDMKVNELNNGFELDNLGAGNYTIAIVYEGNSNFTHANATGSFTVTKAGTGITADISNISYGEKLNVEFTVKNLNTSADVPLSEDIRYGLYIGSSLVGTGAVNIGNGEFELNGLDAGEYSIRIIYYGDANFSSCYKVVNFKVSSVKSYVHVNAENTAYGNPVNVKGEVISSADVLKTDLISITVYDKDNNIVWNASVSVGEFMNGFGLDNLSVGNYILNASYSSNSNFEKSSAVSEFTVSEADTTVNVNAGNVTYNYPVKISGNVTSNVNVPDNGILSILVDNNGEIRYNESKTVREFITGFYLYGLDAGNYTLNIDYAGDGNFKNSSAVSKFSVLKAKSELYVYVNDTVYDNPTVIYGNVVSDVNISEDTIISVNIRNNLNVYSANKTLHDLNSGIIINSLNAGTYTLNILYPGDNNIESATATVNFTVFKASSHVTVNVNNATYNNATVINGNVISNITSISSDSVEIIIYNNGNIMYTANKTVRELKSNITLNSLNAGNYTLNVSYRGNDNIESDTASVNFTVFKASSHVTVNVNNTIYGNAVIINGNVISHVNVSSNDTVNININNNVYLYSMDETVEDLNRGIVINNLNAGNYTLNITYHGNNNLKSNSTTVNFTVFKANTDITITGENINYGKDAVMRFEIKNTDNNAAIPSDENIICTIYDNTNKALDEYKNKEIPISTGEITVKNLNSGSYTVKITYPGDSNFKTCENRIDLTVYPSRTNMNITISNTTYGNKPNIKLTLTGEDNISINDVVNVNFHNKNTQKDYMMNLTVNELNTKGISDTLDAGNYVVNITYPGNSNLMKTDEIAEFTISRAKSSIDLNVISTANNVAVEYSILSDNHKVTQGSVSVKLYRNCVPVKEYTYSADTSPVNITGLAAGNYMLNISYLENTNYLASGKTVNFTLEKSDSILDVNVTVNKNSATITFKLNSTPGLAPEGSFNITVLDGNSNIVYSRIASVNDLKVITTNLSSGTYTVKVDYTGDDNHSPASFSDTFTIADDALVVKADNLTKYYHGSERFTVNITRNSQPVANKTLRIELNGMKYERTTNNNGITSIGINLPSGTYNVSTFVDDQIINSTITIKTTVIGKDLVKVFKNSSQYYVTLYDSEGNPLESGKTVTFNINGVFYTRKTNASGVAKMNINLAQGTYIITANNDETGEMHSNIITVLSRLTDNTDIVKYYRNGTQYTVTVIGDDGNPVGAGAEVIFNINGVFYTRKTNTSGVVKLNINLPEGTYIITAEYMDCKVSNQIKVLPTLTGNDLNKKYGTRDQYIVTLVDGQGNPHSNQNITFNINGVYYTRITNTYGQARLNINLPIGEYIITSEYNGATTSNKITITN